MKYDFLTSPHLTERGERRYRDLIIRKLQMKRLIVVLAILILGAGSAVIQASESTAVVHEDTPVGRVSELAVGQDSVQTSIQIDWNVPNVGPANQTHPGISYDSTRDQILVIWEDGRNDPLDHVDGYGFEYNSDIFGRFYDADGQVVGEELSIATDGEHPPGSGRYDNEQWPILHYDSGSDEHAISWMTLPNSVLTVGDLRTTTCYDLYFRTYRAASASLSSNTTDVAWYTAPPELRDPWNAFYDWSCQQEPASTFLASGISLIVWHDHRERYELVAGAAVNKDIYAQLIDNGKRMVEESILISHGPGGETERLARFQENPDIAGQGEQRLIVWEDERNSATSNYVGYRDIYGRFISYADDVLTLGDEIEIAMGSEGDTPIDYKMVAPRIGYMSDIDAYVIVWSKIANYTDSDNDTFQLMRAIISSDGQFLQTPAIIPSTESKVSYIHDIACSGNRCVLIYRKGENTLNMYAGLMTMDGTLNHEIPLDQLSYHHTYPHLVAGRTHDAQVDFFVGYVAGNKVRVARISTTADPPFTPTPTATLFPTLSPTLTVTPTPSETPANTATSTFTPSATPTSTLSPTLTPTPTTTPLPTPTLTPTHFPTLTATPTPTDTPEPRFFLEVKIVPLQSGGSVIQNPASDADGKYADGSAVTLVAAPSEHHNCYPSVYWSFAGWQGDIVAPSSTMMLVMDSDKVVDALFEQFSPPICTPTPQIIHHYLPLFLVPD